MNSINERLHEYIAQNILYRSDGFPYSDDASFLDEGIIDSTSVLELVMFLEETYKFSVRDQDIIPDNFDSINKLAAYIRRNQGGVS